MGPPKVQFGHSRRKSKEAGRKREQRRIEKEKRRQNKANEDNEKKEMQRILEKTWDDFEKRLNIQQNSHQNRMFGKTRDTEGSGGSVQRHYGFQEGSGNTGYHSNYQNTPMSIDLGFDDDIVEEPAANTPAPIITETHSETITSNDPIFKIIQ